ncbi:MAG TPA: hypothetical protein ENH35_05615 [Candidatus Moranbacteria bacterium]|nr:hypothetical protein [Candidatus Moranbacteria bacterium]
MAKTPKKIVYLIGAGATQAEITHKGGEKVNLLMKDSNLLGHGVSRRVLKKANIDRSLKIKEADIEKLISLLGNSGIAEYEKYAEELREGYFKEIVKCLSKADILQKPELAISLLEMHKTESFNKVEKLSAIISLNHDNLFQVASQKVHEFINLGFKFESEEFTNKQGPSAPLIIQLHGAFNWKNSLPIEVLKLTSRSKHESEILWIPPTILKEAKEYPYNKLMGLAYEALTKKCDILRIVGCSLSQNDWNLISLIFNSQYFKYHFMDDSSIRIELIMNHDTGVNIKKEYAYLKELIPIGYLKDGNFSDYKDKKTRTQEMGNPFKYWLKTKVNYHQRKKDILIEDMGLSLKNVIGVA